MIGHPPTCTPSVVYMRVQMLRDPNSSNRIQISWFVQFLLTFDWFQRSPLVGMGVVLCQGVGGAPCMCTHMHTCAYMYEHDNFMQMAAPIGKSWGILLRHHRSCARVCACAHACACTCVGHPPKHPDRVPPHPPTPTPPKGETPEINQKSIKI